MPYIEAVKRFLYKEKDTDKAYSYFSESNYLYGCAYCKFLQGNIKEAKKLANEIYEYGSCSKWLYFITGLILGEYGISTYFQIRNYYEQDLEMLFLFNHEEIIKKILNENPYIENFNREVYKYSARVLMNNGYYEYALEYLKKSIEICYNDPENHFMAGETELMLGNKEEALKEYKKSSEITGLYLPAEKKIKELTK